jgi:hypothetical protein
MRGRGSYTGVKGGVWKGWPATRASGGGGNGGRQTVFSRGRATGTSIYSQRTRREGRLVAKASRLFNASYDSGPQRACAQGEGRRRGCVYAPCGARLLRPRLCLGTRPSADVGRAHALTPWGGRGIAVHNGGVVATRGRRTCT